MIANIKAIIMKWFFIVTAVLVGFFLRRLILNQGPNGLSSATTADDVAKSLSPMIDGKVFVVTGANSGIGFDTVRVLACNGRATEVAVLARTVEKAQAAVQQVRASCPDVVAPLSAWAVELSSLKSVRAFADQFNQRGPERVDVLILNAGVMQIQERRLSEDGIEMQMQVNHFSQALLTNLIIGKLFKAERPRIVVVSSIAHWTRSSFKYFANPNFERVPYNPGGVYGDTKLANVLFANGLNKHYPRILSVSLHPGVIYTNLWAHTVEDGSLKHRSFQLLSGVLLKTSPQGAATQVFAALSPTVRSGTYLEDCNESNWVSREVNDTSVGKVWTETQTILQITWPPHQ